MSVVNIVIKAVNNAKAAFQDVGNQVVGLNKQINKIGGLFRGIFATGLIASAVKDLIQLSTRLDEVAAASEKVKTKWTEIGEDLADGLAETFLMLEKPIGFIGSIVEKAVAGLQGYYAFFGALAGGAGLKEAFKIARDFNAEQDKEQEARKKNLELAKQQKETEAQRLKDEQELAKLIEENAKRNQERIDESLSTQDLLNKKLDEQDANVKEMNEAAMSGDEKRFQELVKKWDELDQQIQKLYKKRQEEEEDLKKQAIENEKEKLEAELDRIKQETDAKIGALEKQKQAAIDAQKELQDASENAGKLATDKNARRENKERQREEARDKRRLDAILKQADFAAAKGMKLTETQQFAVDQRAFAKQAAAFGKDAENIQAEIDRLKEQQDIAAIREKIEKLLALKE